MRAIPLFDLGNVVVKVDFNPFFDWLAARSRFPDRERVRGLVHSSLWSDFEFGDIKTEQFAARLRALFGAEFATDELADKFCAIFPGPVEGMPELLGELAGREPIYCLSNTNELHFAWLRSHRPDLLRPFARVYTSYEMRARKPFPEIYRHVANELGVGPAELVFFDDVGANVEGALRAGLDAHLFREAGQVREVLKGLAEVDDKA